MEIKEKGFLYRDIELGKIYGKYKVVGFDFHKESEMFICIEHEKYKKDIKLGDNKYISVVLEGYKECKNYRWISKKILLEK